MTSLGDTWNMVVYF